VAPNVPIEPIFVLLSLKLNELLGTLFHSMDAIEINGCRFSRSYSSLDQTTVTPFIIEC
jgi:hypothetical protein